MYNQIDVTTRLQEPTHTPTSMETLVGSLISSFLDEQKDVVNIYRLVLDEVEPVIFQAILKHTNQNQSKAAKLLGISRGTLRKKLAHYGFISQAQEAD